MPAATEIAAALGLMEDVVGVSHECDFPSEANTRPRVTKCPVHDAGLASKDVDEWVRRALRENGTIYTIDEPLLRELRPDVILTQKLCDVCAVGYGTVARLAETLPGPPQVVNLEPSSLSDIFDDIRRIARACDVAERAKELVTKLSARVEMVRERAAHVARRPRCFLMEWVDPPFCSGHWGPELVEIAGGHDPLGRKHQPSAQIDWQEVLDARPEIIVLALCGYDVDLAQRDYELLREFPDLIQFRLRRPVKFIWLMRALTLRVQARGLSTASKFSPGYCIRKNFPSLRFATLRFGGLRSMTFPRLKSRCDRFAAVDYNFRLRR